MNHRIWLRPPLLGGSTGRFKAALLTEPTDLVKPTAIGVVTHEFKAETVPESNGSINAAIRRWNYTCFFRRNLQFVARYLYLINMVAI